MNEMTVTKDFLIDKCNDYLYKNPKDKNFDTDAQLENDINKALKDVRHVYWSMLESQESYIHVEKRYIDKLNDSLQYIDLIKNEILKNKNNNEIYSHPQVNIHRINQSKSKVGNFMKYYFGALPLAQFQDVSKSWNNLIECSTKKAFFVFLGSFITLVFGSFTVLSWVLLVVTVGHFLIRLKSNKYNGKDNYVSFFGNIQLFMWTYFWLAIGNALNYVVTFNGLPDNLFLAITQLWLIWGELKGIVDNAKICNMPIPPIIENIVSNNKSNTNLPF